MPSTLEKRLYLILSEDEQVQSPAEELFDDNYRLAPNILLVRTESFAEGVASKIGLNEEGSKSGVVLKANQTYAGFFDAQLWDWLD